MNRPYRTLPLVSLCWVLAHSTILAAQAFDASTDADHFAKGTKGAVASVSGPASDVGIAILKKGGNAVDAAVAIAFALQATYPLSGNIAGGGFMLVHPARGHGKPAVIDYREAAPAAAWPTMYSREESQFSQRAVAVPGTVRGLELALRQFGTMSWSNLLSPAISLARDGFVLDKALAKSMNDTLAQATNFAELQRVYGKPLGGEWHEGDVLFQPDLARTLETLARLGPDSFYNGPIADGVLAEIQRGKGFITARDLAGYKAILREPLTTKYHGDLDVYVPPPPCSGGVCLIEELNTIARFNIKKWGRWSPKTVHVIAEVMRRANYDRARYLGDPAFVTFPAKLLTPGYGKALARTIDLQHATPSIELSTEIPIAPEEQNTTHFSVIDCNGMAVANTYTLERRWGSRIVVRNMGFLLNNDMRAFNLFPGVTDSTGNVGTLPNQIAPGKRPLSSMTPTIVARDGRVVLVTGSPGSRAIPHTVLQVTLNIFEFGMSRDRAVAEPRFTQEWFPDDVKIEHPELFPDLVPQLERLGHRVVPPSPLPFEGDAHTIFVNRSRVFEAIADHRINGKACAF